MKRDTLGTLVGIGALALGGCDNSGNLNETDYMYNKEGIPYTVRITMIPGERRTVRIEDSKGNSVSAMDYKADGKFDEILIDTPSLSSRAREDALRRFANLDELEKAYGYVWERATEANK